MADNSQTYNPFTDSSIEPDEPTENNQSDREQDLGSEIADQLTGQSYTDDTASSANDKGQ